MVARASPEEDPGFVAYVMATIVARRQETGDTGAQTESPDLPGLREAWAVLDPKTQGEYRVTVQGPPPPLPGTIDPDSVVLPGLSEDTLIKLLSATGHGPFPAVHTESDKAWPPTRVQIWTPGTSTLLGK